MGWSTKVHKDGPDKLVVESGGTIEVKADGKITRAVRMLANAGMRAGSGAGFTVAGNTGAALLPASQTAATLVIPISGLNVDDIITGFTLVGQIESAGNTVTVDANLRKITAAAADPIDASVGAITQVSVTADTKMEAAKSGLSETVAADTQYYILVTSTTLGSTDLQVLGAVIDVSRQ